MLSLLDDPVFSANLFFPRRDSRATPPGARDLSLEVEEGVTLHARIHPAPTAKADIVLFHGNGEVVADYDDSAGLYAEIGARLTIVDYRGYGQSLGAPSVRSTVFDARKAIDGLLPHLADGANRRPLIVMGRSLGSMCAAELMRSQPPFADAFLLESGFTDLIALARRRGFVAEAIEEADLAVLCPLRKLAANRAPLLVLHGEKDTLIVPDEARAAFAASASSEKELVLVPGLGHNDLSFHPLYWKAIGALVERVARAR